jgi:hypothetical protein
VRRRRLSAGGDLLGTLDEGNADKPASGATLSRKQVRAGGLKVKQVVS